ncbi:MAG: CoA pyrophosphatase, partial [Pseudomonadota bacterium]|nr:CoA pyrophosphatase [Pseudomonadota bacterium]
MAKIPFDPELLPVDAIAGEQALAPERLDVPWLRSRLAHPTHWVPEPNEQPLGGPTVLKNAAVLVPLVRRAGGLTMLLTQRTAHLNHHPGQISFPGGRAEAYDSSPIETALRESEEEIGLQRRHTDIIGVLPDYITGTGYRVTPVVG